MKKVVALLWMLALLTCSSMAEARLRGGVGQGSSVVKPGGSLEKGALHETLAMDGVLIDFKTKLPKGVSMLTHESTDEEIWESGADQQIVYEWFDTMDTQVLFVPRDTDWHGEIIVYKWAVGSLDDMRGFEWITYQDLLLKQCRMQGNRQVVAEVYQSPWHRMVHMTYYVPESDIWIESYSTVQHDWEIYIDLCSYGEPGAESESAWLKELADSIHIYKPE